MDFAQTIPIRIDFVRRVSRNVKRETSDVKCMISFTHVSRLTSHVSHWLNEFPAIVKKTTAGKDPVTTLPAAIANEFIIMRKNININFAVNIVALSMWKG